ncbi:MULTISPECIES: hypothetical protein [Streptomyces]|jgi:hypothetical protein|uniref:Integral membrane protein n=1 Tax=Streptomyces doudnae TaxID=3075536 RepID=A0ABD5ESJ7_9ACTN|nr:MULTISPECIES: hypothetical protein [unclassified Streptomyces]MDT0436820.1 hypothetical protein [Streptomyces sp. DSM 41981]MYQ66069.1 hypothetical protein [Streptomyces sp. SID4950]SCE13644.1 hypothetical protein GA0115242_12291 [Streptomyces sp. SolWspMP-5a-2]
MAHAAPAPGGRRGFGTGPNGLPDVFNGQVHRVSRYGIPVVLGLVYGLWAAANRRHGAPITGWNVLFGFATAIAFIVLCIAVARFAPLLKRELHSLVKSAFAGASVGFLYSQTGASVLSSAGLGLAVCAGIFAVFFYRYYTREDAIGNRIR